MGQEKGHKVRRCVPSTNVTYRSVLDVSETLIHLYVNSCIVIKKAFRADIKPYLIPLHLARLVQPCRVWRARE